MAAAFSITGGPKRVAMHRSEPTTPPSQTPDDPPSRVGDTSSEEKRSLVTSHRLRTILWAVATIALFGYIAFGSVPAYTWRFGRLQNDARPVLGIWNIQASDLPDVSRQLLINGVFYGALVAFLIGVTLGLWYLLSSEDSDTSTVRPASSPGAGPTSP